MKKPNTFSPIRILRQIAVFLREISAKAVVLLTTISYVLSCEAFVSILWLFIAQIGKFIKPTWPHLGPVGPRWAPRWPHEPCYYGYSTLCWWFIVWLMNQYSPYVSTKFYIFWYAWYKISCSDAFISISQRLNVFFVYNSDRWMHEAGVIALWSHERHDVSKHRQLVCLLNSLLRWTLK